MTVTAAAAAEAEDIRAGAAAQETGDGLQEGPVGAPGAAGETGDFWVEADPGTGS